MTRAMVRMVSVGLALGATVGACGGGTDDGSPPALAGNGTTSTSAPQAGTGVLNIGADRLLFRVDACTKDPAADDKPQAHRVFLLVGEGTVDGAPFSVEVTRFLASGPGIAVPTTTETIQVAMGSGAEARGLEAERSEVDGDWFDLRDPEPAGALLEIDEGFVRAKGTFGPDASRTGSPDLVTGTFIALCPVR